MEDSEVVTKKKKKFTCVQTLANLVQSCGEQLTNQTIVEIVIRSLT